MTRATTTLKDFIEDFCADKGISKKQLAEYAGITRATLYNMMKNDNSTTLINLAKLAQVMNVHPQYLVQLEWSKYHLSGMLPTPIEALVEPKTSFSTLEDSSHFISETIPDGSLMKIGEVFTKTWRLQNTGNTDWLDRWLVCQDPEVSAYDQPHLKKFSDNRCVTLTPEAKRVPILPTKIGEIVDVSVQFTAPTVPVNIVSYWKMTTADGEICFPESIGVSVNIRTVSCGSAHH